MSRKGENIYRRADGRWEGRYIKGYDVLSGKARYGYVYAESYEKARERRQHAIEAEKARRKSGQAWSSRPEQNSNQKWNHEKEWNGRLEGKKRQAKTVEDCLRRWLAGKEKDTALHPSTIQLYGRQIQKHILPVLGSGPFCDAKKAAWQ